jgi:hypothetical protein
MLLSDHIRLSLVQPFNLLTICNLHWAKYADIAGLEFVRRVRRKATKDNVILEAKFQLT